MSSLYYVTVEEAKEHLRIAQDDTLDDWHISLLINAASNHVKNYLKDYSAYVAQRDSDDDYLTDSNGEPLRETYDEIKPEVKMAVLLMVGEWFKNREGEGAEVVMHAMPAAAMALLYPLRDPATR